VSSCTLHVHLRAIDLPSLSINEFVNINLKSLVTPFTIQDILAASSLYEVEQNGKASVQMARLRIFAEEEIGNRRQYKLQGSSPFVMRAVSKTSETVAVRQRSSDRASLTKTCSWLSSMIVNTCLKSESLPSLSSFDMLVIVGTLIYFSSTILAILPVVWSVHFLKQWML